MSAIKILQISDTHLYHETDKDLLGVKTNESYIATLEYIQQHEKDIDFILHTGDMSQDGSQQSYQRLADTMSALQVPVYYVPGNHDDIHVMNQALPARELQADKHIVCKDWQIILLDSHIHGKVEGKLEADQFEFAEQCLRLYPDMPAMIAFHHHPVLMGCTWLDNLGVINADEFWSFIAKFKNVHTVMFGHVHQEYTGEKNGINLISAPSTCIQFMRKQNEFGLEHLPPGYRVVHLHPEGRLESEVKRIPEYVGHFDERAKGY